MSYDPDNLKKDFGYRIYNYVLYIEDTKGIKS